jgi:hypothetical protein
LPESISRPDQVTEANSETVERKDADNDADATPSRVYNQGPAASSEQTRDTETAADGDAEYRKSELIPAYLRSSSNFQSGMLASYQPPKDSQPAGQSMGSAPSAEAYDAAVASQDHVARPAAEESGQAGDAIDRRPSAAEYDAAVASQDHAVASQEPAAESKEAETPYEAQAKETGAIVAAHQDEGRLRHASSKSSVEDKSTQIPAGAKA